ncbi:MAG: dTMP kinase [Betaproteobacteria bacterium]|nr:dTMP kinase [Betaproteobacteria bacterium]
MATTNDDDGLAALLLEFEDIRLSVLGGAADGIEDERRRKAGLQARGEAVLCDRFTDATFAYQGGGRGFDLEMLSFLEQKVQARQGLQANLIRQPDLTVWFDLAPEVAAVRLAGARLPDRFEAQPLEFFRRVAHAYGQREQAAPGRFARIDANQPRDAVWLAVQQAVQARGWLP